MKLSLIIPCYNEAKNLPTLIKRCKDVFSKEDIEVILVDNGSTDETPKILETLTSSTPNIRFVRVGVNQGYGHGILTGLHAGTGQLLAWTHADMQTDPKDVIKGLEFFDNANSKVFVKGLRYGRPLSDRIFTFGMSVFETLFMGKLLRDINAQPTIFNRAFFENFKSPPTDFSLDLYAYARAREQKYIIKRFPVKFGDRLHGVSSWNVDFNSKVKFIKRTLSYSLSLKKTLKNARR